LEVLDGWHKNLLEINNINLNINNKKIIINYITTDAFSEELLFSEFQKLPDILKKAAEYLTCTYHIHFTGA
jgi:hypothetical protein